MDGLGYAKKWGLIYGTGKRKNEKAKDSRGA